MILIVALFDRTVTLRFYSESSLRDGVPSLSDDSLTIQNEPLLLGLDQFLKKAHKQWRDINGVIVIFGEASFSVTRQAVTILNTLIFTSRLKVVTVLGKAGQEEIAVRRGLQLLKRVKSPQLIKSVYSRPPNITRP